MKNLYFKEAYLTFNWRYLPSKDLLSPLANNYINHKFKILGSEWINVYYGMHTPGFEGTNYSDPTITFAAVFDQLPDDSKVKSGSLIELTKNLVPDYKPIDWFIDFKSGYRYPMHHYQTLTYDHVNHVDAKVPYDMSRHYHLVTLSLACRATGKEKYRKEILAQMMDWIAMNPYKCGIGWHSNMNVAIRAANWLLTLSIIQAGFDANCPDEQRVQEELMNSLQQHRQYMCSNLEFPETDFHPNHYIANLGGLLMTSNFLKNWDSESKGWSILSMREIRLEIDRQFSNDGFNFESTTSYHAFSLEMLIYPLVFAAKSVGFSTIKEIQSWLKKTLVKQGWIRFTKHFPHFEISPNKMG